MSFELTAKGLDELRLTLPDSFSDRRFSAALSTALTRTGQEIKTAQRAELGRVFDRPTPYTLNSLFLKPATAKDLTARVFFKDESAATKGGTPAVKYLLPGVDGGSRRTKRFEKALQAFGGLLPGDQVTPGQGAQLDAFGGVAVSQIRAILAQLKANPAKDDKKGRTKLRSAVQKSGGRYFVLRNKEGKALGVYQREGFGQGITPVLLYVQPARYRKRYDFDGLSQRVADRVLPQQIDRAVSEQLEKLLAKGSK